ncbi:MAG: sporulation protein YunB [Oscillospiraceae bacterium]|jgi:sporulation protein YunB|nr:sporulation protein YunB [Oscillospiraceae bacterium]
MRRRYRTPLSGRQRAALICFFAAVMLTTLSAVGMIHLRSLLGNLAVTRVSNMVSRLVVAAVDEAVQSGEVQYDRLITIEKDNEGHITALQSNMAGFNALQASISEDVLRRMEEISTSDLSIPLGTLTGSALLAGRGPSFTVRMQSTGSCTATFSNDFSDAGINQTTHRILLNVDVSVSILLPGFRTGTKVSNTFSVAETVIVGAVPDSYTYFHSGRDPEGEAYDYAINNG